MLSVFLVSVWLGCVTWSPPPSPYRICFQELELDNVTDTSVPITLSHPVGVVTLKNWFRTEVIRNGQLGGWVFTLFIIDHCHVTLSGPVMPMQSA